MTFNGRGRKYSMNHIVGELSPANTAIDQTRAAKAVAFVRHARTALLYVIPLPEVALALFFAAIAFIIAGSFGLTVVMPSSTALQFTGMSYAVPFSIILAWSLFTILSKRKMRLFYYAAAALSYGIILVVHFNIKLWMNLINPLRWDKLYWDIDQAARPIIETSFAVHRVAGAILPVENHLYLFAFLAMFGCSIFVHSMRCFLVFRQIIFTAMLVHVLGAISYLIMPAVGPYIYENGINALETARQQHMYGSYQALMAGGRPWIGAEGSHYLFAAVAAMPSLHVASSAVFVYYAWKHERWLGWCYLPLFAFIMFEALATRWHYLVDVAAGIGVTALAITITAAVFRPIEAYHKSPNVT
jgi:PAP2 superfamily